MSDDAAMNLEHTMRTIGEDRDGTICDRNDSEELNARDIDRL
jgi:hypothetical protein